MTAQFILDLPHSRDLKNRHQHNRCSKQPTEQDRLTLLQAQPMTWCTEKDTGRGSSMGRGHKQRRSKPRFRTADSLLAFCHRVHLEQAHPLDQLPGLTFNLQSAKGQSQIRQKCSLHSSPLILMTMQKIIALHQVLREGLRKGNDQCYGPSGETAGKTD